MSTYVIFISRKFYIEYEITNSPYFVSTLGIPQGYNVRALLFSPFVNDICQVVQSEQHLFTDDININTEINS